VNQWRKKTDPSYVINVFRNMDQSQQLVDSADYVYEQPDGLVKVNGDQGQLLTPDGNGGFTRAAGGATQADFESVFEPVTAPPPPPPPPPPGTDYGPQIAALTASVDTLTQQVTTNQNAVTAALQDVTTKLNTDARYQAALQAFADAIGQAGH